MNTLKIIIISLFLASVSMAFAQGGKNIKPIDPELLAKHERAGEARDRGRELLKRNQINEAIVAFRESVQIEATYGYHVGIGNYELAKALTIARRTEEALAAYKNAVQWSPRWQDLHVNGPPTTQVLMDYAILLARSGKEEEAKMVYYSELRKYNRYAGSRYEPFPFLVVFDPDPLMDFWEYTPERLITAAKMAKAPFMENTKEMLEEILQMEPNWIVPIVHKASRRVGQSRQTYLDLAMSLARNEDERAWIRGMHADDEPQEIGRNRRLASTVLNQAKLDLVQNHHLIAVCECAGGH